jgi:hypothetical protein
VLIDRLLAEIRKTTLPITGVGVCSKKPTDDNAISDNLYWTSHSKDGKWIKLTWSSPPTEEQKSQAAALVERYDSRPTDEERLNRAQIPVCTLAALLVKSSKLWDRLAPEKKAVLERVIEQAAVQVLEVSDKVVGGDRANSDR